MATSGTGLAAAAIGLREVLFQSVTSMVPAGAVALSIAAGATYAGGALPLAVLLALIACLAGRDLDRPAGQAPAERRQHLLRPARLRSLRPSR